MTAEPEDDSPLHAAINAKLAEIAVESPSLPSWHEEWSRLELHATDEERLKVYKSVRDGGSVPSEAGFFLVAWVIDTMMTGRPVEEFREAEERLEAIRQKYDLEEDTPPDEADTPDEYRQACQQMDEALDALYAAILEEHGEHEMAQLFREDPEQFEELYEVGRQFFHEQASDDEAEGDDWLNTLLNELGDCIDADSPMGPLGLRYHEDDGYWEVWVYPTPVELVGGRHDGEVVVPGFMLDLEQVREAFDSVSGFHWNAIGLNDPAGPHVTIEGVFQGREVSLHVLAYAPDGEEPGLKFDANL